MTAPTDEELRIAVAAALKLRGSTEPDWPNDLNACARFEKTLTKDEAITYGALLRDWTLQKTPMSAPFCAQFAWHASPRLRCLAFLEAKANPNPPENSILREILSAAFPPFHGAHVKLCTNPTP